jgi:hypothetical protein
MVGEDGAVKELAAAHARALLTEENKLPLSEAILTDAGLDFLPLLTELQESGPEQHGRNGCGFRPSGRVKEFASGCG